MRFIVVIVCIISLFGCVKDDFCIDPDAVVMTIDFKTYDSTKLVDTFLNDLSVYDAVNSYEYYESASNLATINIPLDRTEDQQILVFRHQSTRDTITVSYIKEDIFISNGCGYQTYFDIQNVTHSRLNYDSVNIKVTKVDNILQNRHLEVIYK